MSESVKPEPAELAERLRKLATGTVEWRVQHPVEKCYCISFDRDDSINPERAAREWLADHQRRFPNSDHAKYEVAEVRWFCELERTALEAADQLTAAHAAGVRAGMLRAAQIAESMTARERWISGAINSQPAKPCKIAAAIRSEIGRSAEDARGKQQ
jgi:hypothetical protein